MPLKLRAFLSFFAQQYSGMVRNKPISKKNETILFMLFNLESRGKLNVPPLKNPEYVTAYIMYLQTTC